jgi:hypothetical protein
VTLLDVLSTIASIIFPFMFSAANIRVYFETAKKKRKKESPCRRMTRVGFIISERIKTSTFEVVKNFDHLFFCFLLPR